jgi:hypothetical protein
LHFFFFFLLLGRSSATAHHLLLSVQIVNDALGFSGPILLNYLIKFFQSGTQFFLNYVEEWLKKKKEIPKFLLGVFSSIVHKMMP